MKMLLVMRVMPHIIIGDKVAWLRGNKITVDLKIIEDDISKQLH
jgi:hypothetical protein